MKIFTRVLSVGWVAILLTLAVQAATPEPMTLQLWQTLSNDDKKDLIDGVDTEKYSNLSTVSISEKNALDHIAQPLVHEFAVKADQAMHEAVDFEIEDEHSRVGQAYLQWVDVVMIDGQVLGGRFGYIQDGCDLEDENYQYFETEDEAKAAGCDTDADVSWQAQGVYDFDLAPIEVDGYFEWSGY